MGESIIYSGQHRKKLLTSSLDFLGWFCSTKNHPNSVKTILGLNVQGGNSVKSMPGFDKTHVEV